MYSMVYGKMGNGPLNWKLFDIDTTLQCVSFVKSRSVLFDIDTALKCVSFVLID